MRAVVVAVAVLAVALGCWIGAVLGGWSGVVWSCCVLLTAIALFGRAGLGARPPDRVRRGDEPGVRLDRYVRYDDLVKLVRMALRDGRYFANVLAPQVRQLAGQLAAHRRRGGRTNAEAALGERVWQLIAVERGGRERDDPPSAAELDLIISAVERL